ncbi:HD domain-containing protein [Candidatus Parcubacteria bacterium]|nr:HD domain-containing protein [Candidatus Parcubacteria bacterium]
MQTLLGNRPWHVAFSELIGMYREHFTETQSNPVWFERLDPVLRRHLSSWYGLFGDIYEPLSITPCVPLAGFGFTVLEEGIAEDVVRSLGLFRLGGIRQLGFLHTPRVTSDALQAYMPVYSHTRYLHIMCVYALANLMAENNHLSELEKNTLLVAALTHDARTPAGGDSTKRINHTLFDEDASFEAVYKLPGWPGLRERYGLCEKLLFRTIMGEGKLGRLLDLADKAAYIAFDTARFLDSGTPSAAVSEIRTVLNEDSLVCGLWDAANVEGEQVIISDPERLHRFLRLRAGMFKGLYYNPASRFLEDTLARMLISYLLEKGVVTPGTLLQMGDGHLEQLIDQVTGIPGLMAGIVTHQATRVETFQTLSQAEAREAELALDQGIMTHIESMLWLTKSGAKSFLVRGKNKQVATFAEAYPEQTVKIEEGLKDIPPVRLYAFSIRHSGLPNEIVRRLRKRREKRIKNYKRSH